MLVITKPLLKSNFAVLELYIGEKGILVKEIDPIEYQFVVVEYSFRTRESNILVEARDILVLNRLLLKYIER